jgi:hypothetical protein
MFSVTKNTVIKVTTILLMHKIILFRYQLGKGRKDLNNKCGAEGADNSSLNYLLFP